MKIIGIICEYNPFHNGHIYQINKIKELYPDSIIIACMSSSFTERGNISIINKFDKTKIILNHSIDLVVELPYTYTVQSADTFAEGALKILNSLHIDILCFGSESDNLINLTNAAKIQLNNSKYNDYVKKYMNLGNNYPTSLNKALNELNINTIDSPNDLLALSYIKEIIKNKYDIELLNIKRTNDYHDLSSNNSIVSSSNIRNKLLLNEDIKKYVSEDVYNVLNSKNISNKYFELLKYKIISESNLSQYLDINEGIDSRIKSVIDKSNTLEELIENIKTKRYTYNKISRMLNHILCSFTKEENNLKSISYIRVLGFNSNGQKYLNSIKKKMDISILNSLNINDINLNIEKRISKIYSLIYEDILVEDNNNKPIKTIIN